MRLILLTVLCAMLAFMPGAQAETTQPPRLAPLAVDDFYKDNPRALAWDDPQDYADLLSALEDLKKHGLDPAHYHLEALRNMGDQPYIRDRLATDAWFSAAAHMIYGKLDPQKIEPDWTAAKREVNLQALLKTALEQHGVEYSLDLLAPRQPGYWALVGALAKARTRSHIPHTSIPPGSWLREGDSNERVAALQKRLYELGVLERPQQSGVFDTYTDRALRLFQTRAGLEADGIVGPATLAALNRAPEAEINTIRVNLERWRWLPDMLGTRHIRVNIADYNLTAWDDGAPVRSYPIIVGLTYRQTPVFSDTVEYIVFNPWWETPMSLARKDKLPMFREDPGVIEKMGYRVIGADGKAVDPDTIDWNNITPETFPYRIRQEPGPQNALGKVKLMFPNIHNVYIHDTPNPELFDKNRRTFSSGCIRTKNVLHLAAWLLEQNEGWDMAKISNVLESKKETRVDLKSTVPVYILYMTAVVKNYGAVRFVDDIYNRDKAVLEGLNAVPERNHTGPKPE